MPSRLNFSLASAFLQFAFFVSTYPSILFDITSITDMDSAIDKSQMIQVISNLTINLIALVSNIILSYLFYFQLGLMGVALSSVISLMIRLLLLVRANKRFS